MLVTLDAVQSWTLIDIASTHHLPCDLNRRIAKSHYHWVFMAQSDPLPETLISSDAHIFDNSGLQGPKL